MTEWLRKNPNSTWEAEERERHTLQTAADKTLHFIASRFRSDKVALVIELQQSFVIIRQPEEIAFFRNAVQFGVMDQAGGRLVGIFRLGIFVFSLVLGAGRAKPALVMAFVKRVITFWSFGFRDAAPKFTDALVMKGLSGAHEDVETAVRRVQAESRGHLCEVVDDKVRLFLRRAVVALGGPLDIDSVFVGAGEEKRFDSLLPLLARDRVRHNHRVQMP